MIIWNDHLSNRKDKENSFFYKFLKFYLLLAMLGVCGSVGFSLGADNGGGGGAAHCGGLSRRRAQALGHADFNSCSSCRPLDLEHRFSSCGTRA